MHAWLWAEKFRAMADGAIAIGCLPDKVSGRNLLWRRIITTAIRADPTWNDGEYAAQPRALARVLPVMALMNGSAARFQHQLPSVEATLEYLQNLAESCENGQIDANDLVHRIEASADYDPAPSLDNIRMPVLAVNFADDDLNPPVLGVMERAKQKVRNLEYVLIPASDQTQGHRSVATAALYANFVRDFLNVIPAVEGSGN